MTDKEQLENEQRIFDIYSGILFHNQEFAPGGENAEITYDFTCPEYKNLIEKYAIDKTAGEGAAFDRAVRLLHWMSPRLTHKGDYNNRVPVNAIALLDYSLDDPEHGINCVSKAKILAECCLALGIAARRAHLMPCSPYDYDNHVVAEIFAPELDKWVMLDPSSDAYFADGDGRLLSVLELRERFARQRFAAMVTGEDGAEDLAALAEKHAAYNTYFCKNLFRVGVDRHNGFGDGDRQALWLVPAGYGVKRGILANIEYRMRKFPEGKEYFEKWLAEAREKPEPVPVDVSLLAAPPQ